MPTNHTTNYQLSQWSRTDQVKMEDFNADNAKLDAALKAEADARTVLEAKCGNVTMGVFTYTGNGKYGQDNPTRITFPQLPALFIVIGPALLIGSGGKPEACLSYSYGGYGHTTSVTVSWSGNTLSLVSASDYKQMNVTTTYTVIGFYVKE